MTLEQHCKKAELILDNTFTLYEREQAIFKVYLLTGDAEDFYRTLADLSMHVVMQTNLIESADPFMHGKMFDMVLAHIFTYMLDDYHTEFVKWNVVKDGKVVLKED